MIAAHVKRRSCGGPSTAISVYVTWRLVRASSSCRSVLWSTREVSACSICVVESVDDRALDGGEAVLEEDRAERRLDHRREHVAVAREALELLLRLGGSRVLDEALPEAETARHLGAGRAGDDVRAHLGELPLGEVRMARVQRMRNRELEDAVAEELEPLVRGATVVRPRRVGEDVPRQLRRERVDQLREVGIRGYWCELT